jgi:ABC-type Fe3+/spermidine/putrescine transport system ATPase subunit
MGATNLLPGQVVSRENGQVTVETVAGKIIAAANGSTLDKVVISIRPEQIRITRAIVHDGAANRFTGTVADSIFLGESSEHVLLVNGQRLRVVSAPPLIDPPPQLTIEFNAQDAVVLPE